MEHNLRLGKIVVEACRNTLLDIAVMTIRSVSTLVDSAVPWYKFQIWIGEL